MRGAPRNVRVGSNSEVGACNRHVRFPPDSDQIADIAGGPFRANTGHRGRIYLMYSGASGRRFTSFSPVNEFVDAHLRFLPRPEILIKT
jgi:hypothetical protein